MKRTTLIKILIGMLALAAGSWYWHDLNSRSQTYLDLYEKAQKKTEFPILDSKNIDLEVQRLLAPAEIHETREKICRFEKIKETVINALKKRNLPESLVAIPFVQSGFKNLNTGANAGIWYFYLGTAQLYGLKIDDHTDERTDVLKSSETAAKYLTVVYDMLKDWRLVIIAYYVGEDFVLGSIRETKSRDPIVIQKAQPNSNHFLDRVMAALIVMQSSAVVCGS